MNKGRDWNTSLNRSLIRLTLLAFFLTFSPTISSAETVTVPNQDDCPGGNEGWRRGIEANATTKVIVTHCTRMEVVPVPTPTSSSPAPAPAPETVTRVAGATDPYPNISTGGEIPGTRTWSTSENSWAQFATNSMTSGWRCPLIFGPNGDPYAAESNGFDPGAGKWFRVCVKNPWREPVPQSQAQTFTNPATVQTETKTATVQTETKIATVQTVTNTVTTQTETKTATTIESGKAFQSSSPQEINTVIDSDGIEADPEAHLTTKRDASGRTTFTITSNLADEIVIITASKKGSKSIKYSITTDESGQAKLRTTRNLSGFTLTLKFDNEVLDIVKIK